MSALSLRVQPRTSCGLLLCTAPLYEMREKLEHVQAAPPPPRFGCARRGLDSLGIRGEGALILTAHRPRRGQPLLKRFRYHFEGRRETNRRDKPEWVFAHCVAQMRSHAPLLSGEVQPMLRASLACSQQEV